MKTKRNGWPILLFCMMPLIIMGALSWWKGFALSEFMLTNNDEVSWYNQVAAVVEYGKPLGYYGYNGSYAQIGTFGPWGMSVILFMSLIPKLLSFFTEMNESLLIIGNLVWACLANGLFVLLAKPNRGQMKALILLYLCLFVNHLYMFYAMAEILRFSVAVILAGMICFLHSRQDHPAYKAMLYGIVPFSILLASSMYVVFGILLPVWFYFIYQYNEKKLSGCAAAYFAGTLFLSACITLLVYIINGYFECPYEAGIFSQFMDAFGRGWVHGIKYTILSVWGRFKQCSPLAIISSMPMEHGFISSQLLLYYFTLVLAVWAVAKGWKNPLKSMEGSLIAAFVLAAWLVVFIVLYNTGTWTLIRGLNVALIFVLYILAVTETKAMKKIIPVALLGIVSFVIVFSESYESERNDTGRIDLSEKFSELIILDEDAEDPWENTVAYYGAYQKHGFDLPTGAGVNLMLYSGVNEKARYVVIEDDHYIDVEKILQELTENNHEILFEERPLILLKNMDMQ